MKTLTKTKKSNRVRRLPASDAQPGGQPANRRTNQRQPGSSSSGSLFGRVERIFRIDTSFERGLPTRFVPYILYFTIIGLFYIGNSHYAERMVRRMDRLEREVEDLRANYTTLKASYMFESKQSQVAKRVKALGLEESATPPYKIVMPTD